MGTLKKMPASPTSKTEQESNNSEQVVVLVNDQDETLGIASRLEAHSGFGLLHRAISVFLFNERGEVLMQRRHRGKSLWGGYWSNSCCTHPLPNEETLDCAVRRVGEELGVAAQLTFQFKFKYQASFDEHSSEHELCSVYIGEIQCDPTVDPTEIEEWAWWTKEELDQKMAMEPNQFTPWSITEWKRLQSNRSDLKN